MSTKNQRLNATITVGSVLEASVKRNVNFLKAGLDKVGDSIKQVERRQRELDRQRNVLRRQGQSVEHLDREYEKLERTLIDLRRAQERWNRAAAASRRVGSTFNTMATDIGRNARRIAVGATLAGGAIFGLASSTAQLGDDVAKTADKLGIGIQELQELRYAAERSGIPVSAFDTAMEKMTRNIGLALEGTGAQKDALDALGLSAADLATMLPEEALALIADRLQGVETQAERAAIASDIFGRSGIGMLNMLRDGSAGLTQLRDDARRTGYVLSEQAARDAEVFQDTLLDTQLVLKGLKNTVGAELLPVVTQAMRRVGNTLLENREEVQRWAATFADGVEELMPKVGEVVVGIGRVGSVIWGVVASTAEMVGGWENFGMAIGAVLASRTVVRVVKFGTAVFQLGRALFALARTTPLVVGGIRAIGAALLMNPIGLAIAGIAAGAALIYANWDTVGPWFRDQWGNVRQYFGGFADFVGGVFTGDLGRAWDGIKEMWDGASAFWQGIWDGVGAIFAATWENVIKPVTDALGITEPIERAWSVFQTVIGTVVGAIGSVFDTAWSTVIKPVIDGLSSTGGIGAAWETVKTAIDPILTWIGDKFSAVMAFIQPVIDGLTWAMENAQAAGNAIGDAIGLNRNRSVMDDPAAVAATEERLRSGQPSGLDRLRESLPPGLGGTSVLDQFQANALGGPFGPGWHLTGELGPELKFENRSGYVANNRAMRQLAGYADRVGSLMDRPRAVPRRAGAVMDRAARVMASRNRSTQPHSAPDAGIAARVEALFASGGGGAQAAAAAAPIAQTVTKHYHINAASADAREVVRLLKQEERRERGNGLFDRAPTTGPFGR